MTNWDQLNYNYFNHIEVVPYEVPEKEFKWLKTEIEKAKKQKIKANAGLVGHIKEEYNLKRVSSGFENFLITKTDHPAFDTWKKRIDGTEAGSPSHAKTPEGDIRINILAYKLIFHKNY